MDVERLKDFIELAKRKKLAPAARARAMSSSTLSEHISALEMEFGAPLFERLDGFTLTSVGEEALVHAQRILSEYEAIKRLCANQGTLPLVLRMPN